jgi:hypothetical protein
MTRDQVPENRVVVPVIIGLTPALPERWRIARARGCRCYAGPTTQLSKGIAFFSESDCEIATDFQHHAKPEKMVASATRSLGYRTIKWWATSSQ